MKTKEVRKKSRNLKIFAKTPCSRCKWWAVHEGSWPGPLTGLSRPCYGQQWTRERGSGQSPQAEAGPSPVPVSFLLSPSVTSSLTLVHTRVITSPTEWRVCVAGEREPAHWDTNLNTIERGSWREGDRRTDRCALALDCRVTLMILKLVSL